MRIKHKTGHNNSAMKNKTINIPADPLKALCESFQVKELSAFGSFVGEDFKATSDIDLLVEFMPDSKIGFLELSKLQRALSSIFKRHVDLVPKNGLKPVIRNEVLASAEILYAA